MPRRKIPRTWQTLERAVAEMFSALLGVKIFRNILSGSNNRTDDGDPRYGDIAFPKGINWIAECKYRSEIGFHRFYDQAVSDAQKAGFPLDNAILFSKEKGQHPILATISAKKLFYILGQLDGKQIELIFGSTKDGTENQN